MTNIKQNYINHIALVIDCSGSMCGLVEDVVKVADAQIEHLARRSKELDQETRITVYTFSDQVNCLVYDKDVLRMPSLRGLVKAWGNTALLDASSKAIDDLKKTPELYGDHAFLVYVLTDGQENVSRSIKAAELSQKIQLLKDNWTVAVFVPDQTGKFEAKKYGFPADNIAVWETTTAGVKEVGKTITQTTETYMTNRASGTRGYKNLFNLNTATTKADVALQVAASAVAKLHPGQYRLAEVKAEGQIAPFVEALTKRAYRLGEAYYQLSKSEKVQASKNIALRDRKTSEVIAGAGARTLLGLPDHEVRVAPTKHPDYEIFIQSTSTNRKLVPGTKLLLLS